MPPIQEELRRRTRLSRPQVRIRRAEVVRTAEPAPRIRRITIGGPDLAGCADGALPADAWKFLLPPDGRGPVHLPVIGADGMPGYEPGAVPPIMRAFTVRSVDPAANELTVDVLLHGDTPATVWARHAAPGDLVGLAGPRHEFFASPEAGWHLLAGDESALPAIATIIESLPADTPVVALIEVRDEADRIDIAAPAGAEVHWLYRGGAPEAGSGLLEKAVRGLDRPFADAQVWIGAEAAAVRSVRRHLLDERGLPRPQLQAAAYWKRSLTSDQRDIEVFAAYQAAVAAGGDPDDPALTTEADLA
ncbi:NADPH-dependent ferric siderophore reductase, contains FAD-binding and SIP domains [Actinacidiphila alni]|uniref:NADPH-dependent ferric siderophore reductase, contains FAD-binding and SIP domains n=1 Tax=Actinacidiphila alni TaxID=380248 RepID=A0A1I2BCD6_9ACTN|nr:siderophore-interacting protein [Actinacidiphila alni]SFE52973.1 NADPH-dependent ferric siderophore reductase, contains FAD-binding and SIP domains [Actinacidiphila alni]